MRVDDFVWVKLIYYEILLVFQNNVATQMLANTGTNCGG